MTVAVIIVAAGQGARAGGGIPKQFRLCGGQSVLQRCLRPFLNHPEIGQVLCVIGEGQEAAYAEALQGLARQGLARQGLAWQESAWRASRLSPPVTGGATRQASVLAGLEALEPLRPDLVLVHDAARPFCPPALIDRAVANGRRMGAAIPALPVSDTIKQVDTQGKVQSTPDRAGLYAIQTPQAYGFQALLAGHLAAAAKGLNHFTDDAALMEWNGQTVSIFPGERSNIKLTYEEDFAMAQMQLERALITRVGTGYDVHAFTAGDHVWIGGVRLDHDRGVLAHSDGDVALHALTDAVLGALAQGDIGTHFPPSDERWRKASSDMFLGHAMALLRARGGIMDHADLTIICEAPKIGPKRAAIQARIAEICAISTSQVGLKATTSEQMGFTGRKEGLAAFATVTLRLPAEG